MRIAVVVEGKTETAFKGVLVKFLQKRLPREQMPRLTMKPQNGGVPTHEKLGRLVGLLCKDHDAVIVLTDVYGAAAFESAQDAKEKLSRWVGENENFYPHVALHDFEAWLLPYWDVVKELTGTNRNPPSGKPESINNTKPPSRYIEEAFETGKKARNSYSKIRDGARILQDKDLTVAADACPELKAFLNSILRLSGGELLN